MKKIFITFLIISGYILAQEYQITNVPVIQYSVDRYTNEIYYKNYVTGDIYKTNSTGTAHSLAKFPSVPQFSNNSHTAAFMENNNLYLHDFGKDTSYLLGTLPYYSYYLLFSPSDAKIVYGGDDGVPIIYFSFEDSSVHNTGITIYNNVMQWLSDTTIVYITLGGEDIRILNIKDLSENIVVQTAYLVNYRGLATNMGLGAFAYSREYNSAENTFINLYYPDTGLDTTVYNFLEQGPYPGVNVNIFIRDLSWERNSNKLGFIGEVPLIPISLIYVFDYHSSIPYLYSNLDITGEGIKYNLQWLNRDTVIYSDATDGSLLFGLAVTTPVDVRDESTNTLPDNYRLYQNYPNPFNPSTTIRYEIPEQSFVTIKIYDILGNEIATLVNEEKTAGSYEVEFNSHSGEGRNLTSGVYFYQLRILGPEINSGQGIIQTKKMILLR